MNKVLLVGRLGRDVELKYSQAGKAWATFSLATSERYRDQEKTQWHNIKVFGKTAEFASKYLSKGDPACVEGKIEYNKNENSGVTYTNIVAMQVSFVPAPSKNKGADKSSQQDLDLDGESKKVHHSDDEYPF